MSAVGRLQAAIEKLEQLKAESHNWRVPITADEEGPQIIHDFDEEFYGPGSGPLAWTTSEDAAQNIVLLHRTIDAQLAWLRDQHARMVADLNQDGVHIHYRHSLALADAILGDQS